nr:biotin-dependent carboxyltransferase family protein [Propionibacterium sp.]
MSRFVEVIRTGPLALLQDLGRPGYAAVGVGRSGAADRASFTLANRLVGNQPEVGAIEITLGGFALGTNAPIIVALTGAPAPAEVSGRSVPHNSPVYLRAGQVLTLGFAPVGLRTYLAIAGGFDVPPVLGSVATDTMSGLGPAPLAPGRVLKLGHLPVEPGSIDVAPVAPLGEGPVTLRVLRGPRDEWLDDYSRLGKTRWTASSQSDRVGVRLEGQPLDRAPEYADRELQSEGVVRGSIQVPGSGLPVLFLADHPVTGGYPVAGVIRDADTDRLAQVRPGQQIRFQLED